MPHEVFEEHSFVESRRTDIIRTKIASELAWLLKEFDMSGPLANRLEATGHMTPNLRESMTEAKLASNLDELLKFHPGLVSLTAYAQWVTDEGPMEEPGLWTYEQIMANLSNENP